MIRDAWKSLTTTVGLVTSRNGAGVNVMAAEWTYFVAKNPPHLAVVLRDGTLTQELVLAAGEFGVTLCSAEQAALADFVGSVSGREIDKTATELLTLAAPGATSTAWVEGGVAAFECVLRQVVRLPDYRMMIGEVVAAHPDRTGRAPLVKRGRMYALGEELERAAVVAAAELRAADPPEHQAHQAHQAHPVLRVAATGQAADPAARWQVRLVRADGSAQPLGEEEPDEYGDLLVDYPPPPGDLAGCRVEVRRAGLRSGLARIARNPARNAVGVGPS